MHSEYIDQEKKALISTLEQLEIKYQQLKIEYDQLRRLVFGSKSERFVSDADPAQLKLLEVAIRKQKERVDTLTEEVSKEITEMTPEKKPKRTRLAKKLKRVDTVIEPEGDLSGWKKIGEQITEQLDYQPAVFFVRRYIRPKYVNPADPDQGVVIADLPSLPITKGKAGAGLLSKVIIDKYVDHIPCYRQEKIYARYGEKLSRSTLCDWIAQSADLLNPLYEHLKKQVLSSGYIQVDESPIPVLTQDQKGSAHRGYMWVYQAVNEDLVVFDYQPSKEGKVVAKMLNKYKGYLQTDGYAAYDMFKSNKKVKPLHCWAHARRYFHKALENDKDRASYALGKIGELYLLERTMKKDWPEIDPYHIQDVRQRYAVPILLELESWLRENLHVVKPKSSIGRAIRYTLKRFKELKTYTTDGRLHIDNNPVENSIRPLALGRKNYLFAGSHAGARRTALMYSLLGTCKIRQINPFHWLKNTLEKIPDTSIKEIQKLMPPVNT